MKTLLLFLLITGGMVHAESSDLPLPRSPYPLYLLAHKCQGALVATLVSITRRDPGPPGATDVQSHWKVLKVLLGDYPEEAELTFRVQTITEEKREREPTVGQTYILLSYPRNQNQIANIIDQTAERVTDVQGLLEAKSKSEGADLLAYDYFRIQYGNVVIRLPSKTPFDSDAEARKRYQDQFEAGFLSGITGVLAVYQPKAQPCLPGELEGWSAGQWSGYRAHQNEVSRVPRSLRDQADL